MTSPSSTRFAFLIALLILTPTPGWSLQETPESYNSMDDSFAALVIGDFKGLLEGAVEVVNRVVPGMGAMIPMQVGGFLIDPSLSGFAPGSGLVLMSFPGGQMAAVAEIEEAHRESYVETAKLHGVYATIVDDLVVSAPDEAGLATASAVAAEVKEALLGEPAKATLHLLVHVPKILSTYQSEIDEGLKALPELMKAGPAQSSTAPAATEAIADLVEAEMLVLHHLASQLEIFEAELDPAGGDLLLTLTFMPEPGTNLATLLTTAQGGEPMDLIQKVPAGGAIRMEANYDPQAAKSFLMREVESLCEKVDWGQQEETDLRNWLEQSLDLYGQGYAGSSLGESGNLMSGAFISKSDDPQKTQEAFKNMMTQMGSSGILDFYTALGMDMKFDYRENVREYKGIPIHRLEMNLDTNEQADPVLGGFMKQFSEMGYDLAVVEDYFAYAMGDSSIDAVIDRVQSGGTPPVPPLRSKQELGDQGAVYADFDLAGYLSAVSSILGTLPPEGEGDGMSGVLSQIEAAAAPLAGAPPIMVGVFGETDQAKVKLKIPAGLLEKVAQVVGAMMPTPSP